MNVGKERDAEVDQVVAQGGLGLSCAFKSHGKGGRAGHGAYGGHVGRAVVLNDIHGISSGIGPCDAVEQGHPDIVADHDDHDDDQEDGQLLGDGAFIGQGAEGAADQHRQDRDHELCHDAQNDLLELLQDTGDQSALVPGGSKAYQNGEEKGRHDRHDLGNGQLEENGRQVLEAVHFGADVQEGQDGKAGSRSEEGSADGRNVGDAEGHQQHAGGVVA